MLLEAPLQQPPCPRPCKDRRVSRKALQAPRHRKYASNAMVPCPREVYWGTRANANALHLFVTPSLNAVEESQPLALTILQQECHKFLGRRGTPLPQSWRLRIYLL